MTYFRDARSEWVPLYDQEQSGASANKEIIGYTRDFHQYGRVTVSNRPDASGRFAVRHADPDSDSFTLIPAAAGATPDEGMRTVTDWANHSLEMASLGRRSVVGAANTPWGPVGHVIDYGEGLVRAFSARGSRYHLADDLIERLPLAVRNMSISDGEDGAWFPDDAAGPYIVQALPELFTSFEMGVASDALADSDLAASAAHRASHGANQHHEEMRI